MSQKTGRLFSRAILALSVVSALPVLLIGWHVLRVDNRVLQNEILDKQRTVAGQIASVLSEEISRKAQFFSVFTDLHTDFGGHPFIDKEDIDYLRIKNPEITHISVLNNKGRQLFYSSEESSRFSYASELDNILHACVAQGKDYVGSVNRVNGQLYALMAFPLRRHLRDVKITGVLVVEMNLATLGSALQESYPEDLFVAVTSADGSLISYSGAEGGLALEENLPLRARLQRWQQALDTRNGARLELPDGQAVLVSRAQVPVMRWTVYVQQPADTIRRLLLESTFHSLWDVLVILLVMIAFVLLTGYFVISPIVRPVRRLQEAAVKLEQEEDYMPQEQDLIIPRNEIGQLARVFLHMAQVLRDRKNALVCAQQELAGMNKELELRVQQRTAELKAATDELVKTERLAAIGQMASIISHEIRNPLAVISNATRLIKTIEPPKDAKLIKQFSIIEAEIKQANSIISEVLGFARSRDMILSTIDLNSYLHDLLLSFPASSGIRLQEKLDPESVHLKIDAEEMKQAVRNLISNACEAMQGQGTVTLGTRVGKKVVCIYVADEGPGVPDALKEKIFSPFFTTKARGTGLGLAVVRKAVGRHKGKMFIHNRATGGAVFEIYLTIYRKTGDTRYG
ncbi:ATP-binding protein [Candidatus Avelusimicrobium facis]|uniref:sensor histidine kinase n=1 Tax=Candidatus Avelusimicrobium facis TaxID=3416203 RepID=UPI0015B772C4